MCLRPTRAANSMELLAMLVAAMLPAVVVSASTMGAFYVPSAGSPPLYSADFATPKVGSLHAQYPDLPTNASCEVLIEVYASSVNPADVSPHLSSDSYPKVLGSDVAGVVVDASGDECSRLQVGDRVWGDIGANTRSVGGVTKELGAYAQYVVALESQLATIPPTLGFVEAGALPKVALTSYKALVWFAAAAQWPANADVLILGGSGGCGTTAIQLAKALAAARGLSVNVTTTTSEANVGYVRLLGADQVIDYKTQDWWAVLPDDSFDVIYDTVGQLGTGLRAMKKLRDGGHYVTIAGALAPVARPGRHQAMFINSDTNLGSAALMEELGALASEGKLRMPRIDSSFGLAGVAEAFARVQSGRVVGKVSIVVAASLGADTCADQHCLTV